MINKKIIVFIQRPTRRYQSLKGQWLHGNADEVIMFSAILLLAFQDADHDFLGDLLKKKCFDQSTMELTIRRWLIMILT